MYKLIFALLIGATPIFGFSQDTNQDKEYDHGCPISYAEKVVCGKMMCDFGLMMGEYPDRCYDYEAKLLGLKSKLLPWEKLPRCYKRDENCNKSGRAGKDSMDVSYCMENTESKNDRESCLSAINQTDENYCSTLKGDIERRACEEIKISGRLTEEYCDKMAMGVADIRKSNLWSRWERWDGVITKSQYWLTIPEEKKSIYLQSFEECMSLNAK